jgi:hypothetical protein
MSWQRNAKARSLGGLQSQSLDECAGRRWTSTLPGLRGRRGARPHWARACRFAAAGGFVRTLPPHDLPPPPDSQTAGSGSLRSQPPRPRLDQFLPGRRADGLRLVSGVLSGLLGLVEGGRGLCAHGWRPCGRARADPGRSARRCRAVETRSGRRRDRGHRGIGTHSRAAAYLSPRLHGRDSARDHRRARRSRHHGDQLGSRRPARNSGWGGIFASPVPATR